MNNNIKIIINRNTHMHTVSPALYSHFVEHIGGCIYDGIWVGEDSEIPNMNGIRIDTVEALKKLEIPVIRWPGGLFADNYHWMEGIGPREKRPVRYNLGWNMLENNHFGTDEFMRFCEMIGAEPYLCCNMGTGTVEEARSWAEYCNCDKPTSLVKMRMENGHPEPYNVKYWGVGNEPYYCLDGMMTTKMYADVYRRYSGYIKRFASQDTYQRGPVFESTKLIAGIADEEFLEIISNEYVDLIAAHCYYDSGPVDPQCPEKSYNKLMAGLEDMDTELNRCCSLAEKYSTDNHRIEVALDEWGTWHWSQATPLNAMLQDYNLQDALFAAAAFHIMHKYEKLHMANIAQTINVLQALVHTRGKDMVLTPTYYVYDMLKPHKGNKVLDFKTEGIPSILLEENKKSKAVSISATISNNNMELFVSIVNIDASNEYKCNITLSNSEGWELYKQKRLWSSCISDGNSFDKPHAVVPEDITKDEEVQEQILLKPHSLTTLKYRKVATP